MKGYATSEGYMGLVQGRYMLFASEVDYREYMEDYFEIFLQRMLMCKRAAEILGLKFKMKANGNKIC